MNPDTKAAYDTLTRRMTAAFKLVEPKSYWKGPIDAVVTADQLRAADVTIADVVEAVSYFTGTVAAVETAPSWVALSPMFHVTAIGYLAGLPEVLRPTEGERR